jgi:hypothetical protein
MRIVKINAGHEGVQAVQPMDAAFANETIKRPVNGNRRAEALAAHGLKKLIGGQRRARLSQMRVDPLMIVGLS